MKQRLKSIRPPATPRLSVTITLTIAASLLTALAGVVGNIATASIPEGLKPYLSYAWLVLLVLVILGIVVTAWQAWYDSGQTVNSAAPASSQTSLAPVSATSLSSPAAQSVSMQQSAPAALPQSNSAPANTSAASTLPTTSSTPAAGSSLYHSCMLSYSTEDEQFVKKLYADLQAQGVSCWLAEQDIKQGDKLREDIYRAIRQQDKLLLVLSHHAIESKWVEEEVDVALDRERQQVGALLLFPIRLDEAVFTTEKYWAITVRQRRIGDFRQWQDDAAYQQALQRLLRDLHV